MSISTEPSAQVLDPAELNVQQSSPLLNLPAELRNQIYAYVFGKSTYTFRLGLAREDLRGILVPNFRLPEWICLPETCRQIHTETAQLPFENNLLCLDELDLIMFLQQLKRPPQTVIVLRLEVRKHTRIAAVAEDLADTKNYLPKMDLKMAVEGNTGEDGEEERWVDVREFPDAMACETLVVESQVRVQITFLPLPNIRKVD